MPYARRPRRTAYRPRRSRFFKSRTRMFRRRGYRRSFYKRKSRSLVTTLIKGNMASANRTFVKLRMYGSGTLKASAGTIPFLCGFSGNDINTPDVNSACNVITMQQGYGRDQWYTFYTNCYVSGSKISLKIKNITGVASATSTNYQPIQVNLFPYDSTTNGSYTAAKYFTLPGGSQPYCQTRMLGQPDAGGSQCWLKAYATTKRTLGVKVDLDEPNNLQTVAAGPTNLWIWVLSGGNLTGANALTEISFEVKITYYCCFLNRIILAKS